MRNRLTHLNGSIMGMLIIAATIACLTIFNPAVSAAQNSADQYEFWSTLGRKAAMKALDSLRPTSWRFTGAGNYIVLSNAGYAEVNEQTTMAALDGLSNVIGVSRGANTLVEVHSAPRSPLWFAVFNKQSGYCAYLQVDPDQIGEIKTVSRLARIEAGKIFKIMSTARIDADYLFSANPAVFAPNFGDNVFRIVTIANGIAAGVPAYVVRSFEFHDHYCPGVSSAFPMANYAKKFFTPSETESWFVQGVQPWCKEDALMVMLNATPGKSGYGVTYSTASDRAAWDYPNAATIIYHKNATDTQWQGIVISFAFPDGQTTGCAKYTDATINKLCADMWFLEKLDDQDTIETLMKVERKFKLPVGKQPKDYAAPGVDVMKQVGGFEEM
jgi:formylmethanofuran dehydrogenase subunit E-like metal-binding protein